MAWVHQARIEGSRIEVVSAHIVHFVFDDCSFDLGPTAQFRHDTTPTDWGKFCTGILHALSRCTASIPTTAEKS